MHTYLFSLLLIFYHDLQNIWVRSNVTYIARALWCYFKGTENFILATNVDKILEEGVIDK